MLKGAFLVEPAPHLIKDKNGWLSPHDIKGLPIWGKIVDKCRALPGRKCGRLDYLWTAHYEERIDGLLLVQPELVYRSCGIFMNGWNWAIPETLEEDLDLPSIGARAKVIGGRWKGKDVVYEKKLSHNIMAEEFAEEPIIAFQNPAVLLYR